MRNTFPNQDGDTMIYRMQTLSQVLTIPNDRMAHLMWEVHPYNSYLGVSPLRYANPWILLDRYAAEGARPAACVRRWRASCCNPANWNPRRLPPPRLRKRRPLWTACADWAPAIP